MQRSHRIGLSSFVALAVYALFLGAAFLLGIAFTDASMDIDPGMWGAGVRCVNVVEEFPWWVTLDAHEGTNGLYVAMTKCIYIKRERFNIPLLQHEVGHHVWYQRMTREQRNAWKEMWAVHPPITQYGATNAQEDFADTFMLFQTGFSHEVVGWRRTMLLDVLCLEEQEGASPIYSPSLRCT